MDPFLLRQQAETIWRAGVAAVDSQRLVRSAVRVDGSNPIIAGDTYPLSKLGRIAVVGAGKAGAGMAAAFEEAVGKQILHDKVTGWVNVPADCVRPLTKIHLHAARPAGVNEPTAEGVEGSERILEIVASLGPDDLCVVLLSGGGSALLPAPIPEISLADKLTVTRLLMSRGATIRELNCVRKHLSRIKGGRLGLASRAGHTVALIISDVVGDPLDMIASGPTVADTTTASDALLILQKFAGPGSPGDAPRSVWDYLEHAAAQPVSPNPMSPLQINLQKLRNVVIGNNEVALNAAMKQAQALGYQVTSLGSALQGEAKEIGKSLAKMCRLFRSKNIPPMCVLGGGEPVVHLAKTDQPRKGGRNQEVALAALVKLWDDGLDHTVILAGGTDGEDGPTDAAGAVADASVWREARAQSLDPREFLAINNSYPFFEQTDGLLKTGPTHTNVMDLHVALVR